jgi:LysR family transcriptional regulator, hca operon transcriptional activator
MPSDRRLARLHCVDVRQLANDVFIGASNIVGPIRGAIEADLAANKLDLEPAHRVHNLTMAMSLIASTRGIALLPAYAEELLPWSVTSRTLQEEAPTIVLVIGYNRSNTSPTLSTFLGRAPRMMRP